MFARFELVRHEDVTGVSGTGVVAQGVQFDDGIVVVRWLGQHASTVIWPGIDDVEHIHGHDGRTEIRWLDHRWLFEKIDDNPMTRR